MTDIHDLAAKAARRFDIDEDAALETARIYLVQAAQAEGTDPRLIDEGELTEEQEDTVMTAIEAGMEQASPEDDGLIGDLTDLRARINVLETQLEGATEERDRIIRRLLSKAVVPVNEIAEAAGLSRARIYQIRDGER